MCLKVDVYIVNVLQIFVCLKLFWVMQYVVLLFVDMLVAQCMCKHLNDEVHVILKFVMDR